ncbi:MAG TPA: FeoA family protein [Chitinophagaceae bacterium]|jgi:ferrous iron transport protein A
MNRKTGFGVHNFKIRKQIRNYNFSFDVMTKKLSELKQGERGIIKKFTNTETYLKLMEMGCVPGESVLLEQVAPFGDPISVKISGYLLSLRINEARDIEVELID